MVTAGAGPVSTIASDSSLPGLLPTGFRRRTAHRFGTGWRAHGGYDRLNGSLDLSIKSVRMNVVSLRLLWMHRPGAAGE
jgi:hypothetical protein